MIVNDDTKLREARNTSMKHVARLFLSWFSSEMPAAATEVRYAGDFVKWYIHNDTEYRAMEFVSKLARERLSYAEANQTIDWAYTLMDV